MNLMSSLRKNRGLLTLSLLLPLTACSTDPSPVDPFEQLERPPKLARVPSHELPAIVDENVATNGLGERVKLQGKKSAPYLTVAMDFDRTWQLLNKVFNQRNIAVTDHDREQGLYLVNFDVDSADPDEGFFSSLGSSVFADKYGLRKYQLRVTYVGAQTRVVASDLGAITTEADPEEEIQEVVNKSVKGPEDSTLRLLSTLHKIIREGFVEPEVRHGRGHR